MPDNTAPIATDDEFLGEEDNPLAGNVLTNDSDPDGDPLTVALLTGPTNGTIDLQPDGGFVYTPNPDFWRFDGFTYQLSDGRGGVTTGTVSLLIAFGNDAPVAGDDGPFSTTYETEIVIPRNVAVANDSDIDGGFITIELVQDAVGGSVGFSPFSSGNMIFTPAPGFSGTASYTYTARDDYGATDTATVTIEVGGPPIPGNSAPTGENLDFTVDEDGTLIVEGPGLLAFANDPDGDALSVILTHDASFADLFLNADGSFTITPFSEYTDPVFFNYRVSDGNLSSEEYSVVIHIRSINDPPIPGDDEYVLDEDTILSGRVTENDNDLEDDFAEGAVLVSGPSNGTLVLEDDGYFTYTPNGDFSGTDSFTYRPSDGLVLGDIANVTLIVNPVEDAPDAVNDGTFATAYQTALVKTHADLLANDGDADGDALSIVSVQGATNGSVSLNAGTVVFTPTAGYSGAASYSYTINDLNGGSDTATVSLTVGPPPSGGADDFFFSLAGAETFNGGAGNDTVSYLKVAGGGVTVRLASSAAQNTGAGGVDTLLGIENLRGSRQNDNLYGDAQANLLNGEEGNDFLEGGGGDDQLSGASGNDTLDGGLGDDRMDGGAGIDTLSYLTNKLGVTISLAITQVQDTGTAGVDRVAGFENLTGSRGSDVLSGDDAANAINGAEGDDRLFGRGGADSLQGGAGNDTLDGGAGYDVLAGGIGVDTFVFTSLDGDLVGDWVEGEKVDATAFAGSALSFETAYGRTTVRFDTDLDGAFDDGFFVVQSAAFAADDVLI